jgi:heme iron utilization protein
MTQDNWSPEAVGQGLLAAGGSATLATLARGGGPFASYVIIAPAADGSPLMLLSSLAAHTKNLENDARASLLFVREAGDEAMAALRLTLTGRCARHDEPAARSLFLARHPDAARYAGFADFGLYRFEIEAGHLVAGFGRIVGLTREALLHPVGSK